MSIPATRNESVITPSPTVPPFLRSQAEPVLVQVAGPPRQLASGTYYSAMPVTGRRRSPSEVGLPGGILNTFDSDVAEVFDDVISQNYGRALTETFRELNSPPPAAPARVAAVDDDKYLTQAMAVYALGAVLKAGWLLKKGSLTLPAGGGFSKTSRRNWKQRWFRLHSDRLLYYTGPQDEAKLQGTIQLADYRGVQVTDNKRHRFHFELVSTADWQVAGTRTYEIVSSSAAELEAWTSALRAAGEFALICGKMQSPDIGAVLPPAKHRLLTVADNCLRYGSQVLQVPLAHIQFLEQILVKVTTSPVFVASVKPLAFQLADIICIFLSCIVDQWTATDSAGPLTETAIFLKQLLSLIIQRTAKISEYSQLTVAFIKSYLENMNGLVTATERLLQLLQDDATF